MTWLGVVAVMALAATSHDELDHAERVQLLVLIGVIVTAVAGVIVAWLTHRKVGKVYDHVNSVEVEVDPTGGERSHPTLGQMVRDGFRRNSEEHVTILGRLDRIEQTDDQHGDRIGHLEREVDRLWERRRPSRQRPPREPPSPGPGT